MVGGWSGGDGNEKEWKVSTTLLRFRSCLRGCGALRVGARLLAGRMRDAVGLLSVLEVAIL